MRTFIKQWWGIGLAVVGVLITISARFVQNLEDQPNLLQLLAPSYVHAMNAYHATVEKSPRFQTGDTGFAEMRELILDNIRSGDGDADQFDIKWFRFYNGTPEGSGYLDNYGNQEVFSIDGRTLDGKKLYGPMFNLKKRISSKYLDPVKVRISRVLFWTGILITVCGISERIYRQTVAQSKRHQIDLSSHEMD